MEMVQLDKGELKIEELKFKWNDFLSIHKIKNNKKILVKTDISDNLIRFNIPSSNKLVSGVRIGSSNVLVYEPNKNYVAILPDDNDTIEVEVDCDYFKSFSPFVFERLKESQNSLLVCEVVTSIREFFDCIFFAYTVDKINKELIQHHCESMVLIILEQMILERLDCQQHFPNEVKCGKNWILFKDIVRSISIGGEIKNVNHIVEKFGIGKRSLLNLFKRYIGISPSQYLLAHKLCAAQTSLCHERRVDDPVTRAAVDVEIYHLGRFSQYYKSFFGHLPSDAVNRAHE